MEEQTAQITRDPLLVGVASLAPLRSLGDPFIGEPVAPAEGWSCLFWKSVSRQKAAGTVPCNSLAALLLPGKGEGVELLNS